MILLCWRLKLKIYLMSGLTAVAVEEIDGHCTKFSKGIMIPYHENGDLLPSSPRRMEEQEMGLQYYKKDVISDAERFSRY